MFDKIIYSGNDQMTMAVEIVRSGYGQMLPEEQADNDIFNSYSVQDRRNHLLLQMYMLADEIIFTDLPDCYDLTKLSSIDNFQYNTIATKHENLFEESDTLSLDSFFAEYIHPLAISFLVNSNAFLFPKSNKLHFWDTSYRFFYPIDIAKKKEDESNFFNLLYSHYNEFINAYRDTYNTFLKKNEEETYKAFYNYIKDEIHSCVEDIVWRLELSAHNECPIIQDDYDFSAIAKYQPYLTNTTPYAYTLLRVRCEQILGPLPEFTSFNDVIRAKNQHRIEINRLRNVLSEFEYILRTDGTNRAISKITQDIQLAAKELAKKESTILSTAKWFQYLAIPITLAETIIHSSIPITGLMIEAVGQLTELGIKNSKKKNEWLNLVR